MPHLPQLRLQFNLRVLLLLMVGCAVGMAVYRWPWTETVVGVGASGPEERTTVTSYRRGWWGKKERHGTQRETVAGRLTSEALYLNDQLRRKDWFNERGQTSQSEEFRLDGTYFSAKGNGELRVQQLSYLKDDLHGESRSMVNRQWGEVDANSPFARVKIFADGDRLPADPILVVHSWQNGRRQGPWSWETLDGQVLQRAVYQNNELTEWNGQPVVQQFRDWLRERAPANASLDPFLRDDVVLDWQSYSPRALGLNWRSRGGSLRGETPVMVDVPIGIDQLHHGRFELRTNESLGAAVCEFAALQGYRFSYRYGVLWLTPQIDAGSVFGDRTGVQRVKFAANSPEDKAWHGPCTILQYQFPLQLRNGLAGVLHKTNIELDLSQLPETSEQEHYPPMKVTRRDAFGYLLYVNGLRCAQQGNKLIVSYRLRL